MNGHSLPLCIGQKLNNNCDVISLYVYSCLQPENLNSSWSDLNPCIVFVFCSLQLQWTLHAVRVQCICVRGNWQNEWRSMSELH